jgi:hypothetical protein
MNVNLHIERLVLDGVGIEPGQRDSLQAAIESELRRRFRSGALGSDLVAGAALPHLNAAQIRTTVQVRTADLGQQIAGAIHEGLAR